MVTNDAREIFRAEHPSTQTIRIVYRTDERDGSKGFDIFVDAARRARVYNPADVTTWFKNFSIANRAKWQVAYWRSGLKEGDFKRAAPLDIALKVPYYSQRDNERSPSGTCNVTSYAMVLAYYNAPRKEVNGKKWTQREDELEAFIQANGKVRWSHEALAWMGRQYGLDCRFNTNRTWDEVRAEIRAGRPVIVSGLFTKSGHIVVIIGLKGDDFIVHDPWGDANAKYNRLTGGNGEARVYSFAYLDKVVRAARGGIWAHFIRRLGA